MLNTDDDQIQNVCCFYFFYISSPKPISPGFFVFSKVSTITQIFSTITQISFRFSTITWKMKKKKSLNITFLCQKIQQYQNYKGF